jgi:hypothetical protein
MKNKYPVILTPEIKFKNSAISMLRNGAVAGTSLKIEHEGKTIRLQICYGRATARGHVSVPADSVTLREIANTFLAYALQLEGLLEE